MNPDILIIRDACGYRLLHGHLRLANELRISEEIAVEVAGEGKVRILKTRGGYLVSKDDMRLPLLRN